MTEYLIYGALFALLHEIDRAARMDDINIYKLPKVVGRMSWHVVAYPWVIVGIFWRRK